MAEVAVDLLQGAGLASRAIEWFGLGAGGYSHAASVLADGRYLDARSDAMRGVWRYGPHMGLEETVPPGVHVRDPHWERSLKRTRYSFQVSPSQYEDWEANLRAKIGTPYARRAIFGFITGRQITVHGEWICSMLAINALQHIKIIVPLSIEAHQVTPDMAGLLMEQAGARLSDPGL